MQNNRVRIKCIMKTVLQTLLFGVALNNITLHIHTRDRCVDLAHVIVRLCVTAEAGRAGQEGFKREGAAAERAPLPQTPLGAAFCVRISRARPHRQHGLHHLHRLRARFGPFNTVCHEKYKKRIMQPLGALPRSRILYGSMWTVSSLVLRNYDMQVKCRSPPRQRLNFGSGRG